MNNAFRLSGMGVNLVTPFNAAGEIDFPALERLVLKIKSTPIEFIAVNGSASGSSPAQSGRVPEELGIRC